MLNYYNICLFFSFSFLSVRLSSERIGMGSGCILLIFECPLSSSSLFTVSTSTSQQGLRNVNEVDYTWRYNFSLLSIHKVFAAAFEQRSQPISTLAAVCRRVLVWVSAEPLLRQGWMILVTLKCIKLWAMTTLFFTEPNIFLFE